MKFDDLWARGEAARRLHSHWLTRALRAGSVQPRIPVRRVSEGGFTLMTATAEGRAWADDWWRAALDAPDPD